MKFNPLEYNEVKGNEVEVSSGIVRLRASAPFSVAVIAHGVEASIGRAASHEFRLAEPATLLIEAEKGLKVFIKDTPSRVVTMKGEKFTNIDRMPHESGSLDAVTRAVRLLRLQDRARLRQQFEERELLELQRKQAAAKAASGPKVEAKQEAAEPPPAA